MTEQQLALTLRESSAPSVPLRLLHPEEISVQAVPVRIVRRYQRVMSRAIWRPSPGRNLSFTIVAGDDLLGIAFLSSPVFNLAVRDGYLGIPKDDGARGERLRHFADLSVCVASQPIGWHWNLGKLVALLATTLGPYWEHRYGDALEGITTTSLWGKSSQYNRIYKFLGYTKGYGHEHVPEKDYREMRRFVVASPESPVNNPRELTNGRMKVIEEFARLHGQSSTRATFHGTERGVYYSPVTTAPPAQVIADWYARWGLPRYERTKDSEPPYLTGLSRD